jgi:predicted sulfurtransferase
MKNQAKKSRNDLLPLILIGIGVLLVIGVIIWQAVQNGQANTQQASPESGVQRVSLQDAKAAYDQKSAVFVDVRAPDSYNAGHIPGALNIPLAEMETRAKELDANQWIIPYCT